MIRFSKFFFLLKAVVKHITTLLRHFTTFQAGEEIFAYYGYDKSGQQAPFPNDFPWYWRTLQLMELEDKVAILKAELEELEKKSSNTVKNIFSFKTEL